MAWDEGYAADARRAASIAFWFSVLLYPAFGLMLALDVIVWNLAFAAMGTLIGAFYLLLLAAFDLRGPGQR